MRQLLESAGNGPASTRALAVDLMESLIARGHLDSVRWFLAPTPAAEPDGVVFDLRSSEDDGVAASDPRPLDAVLADARRLATESEWVEVWSEDGDGVRRLVLAGGNGAPLRYLGPELDSFAGEGSRTVSAVAAWQRLDEHLLAPWGPERAGPNGVGPDDVGADGVGADGAGADGVAADGVAVAGTNGRGGVSSSRSILVPVEQAEITPVSEDVRNPVSDAEIFGRAVQQALNQMSVEVDLGSIEELVVEAVHSALAQRDESAMPRPAADGEGDVELTARVDPDQLSGLVDELRQMIDTSVAAAVEAGLAKHLPLADDHDASPEPDFALPEATSFDPYDHARRHIQHRHDEH